MNIQQLEAIETCNNAIRYLIHSNSIENGRRYAVICEALPILQTARNNAKAGR